MPSTLVHTRTFQKGAAKVCGRDLPHHRSPTEHNHRLRPGDGARKWYPTAPLHSGGLTRVLRGNRYWRCHSEHNCSTHGDLVLDAGTLGHYPRHHRLPWRRRRHKSFFPSQFWCRVLHVSHFRQLTKWTLQASSKSSTLLPTSYAILDPTSPVCFVTLYCRTAKV